MQPLFIVAPCLDRSRTYVHAPSCRRIPPHHEDGSRQSRVSCRRHGEDVHVHHDQTVESQRLAIFLEEPLLCLQIKFFCVLEYKKYVTKLYKPIVIVNIFQYSAESYSFPSYKYQKISKAKKKQPLLKCHHFCRLPFYLIVTESQMQKEMNSSNNVAL